MALTKIPASLLDTSVGLDLQGNITLGDNEQIQLGADNDLSIYHSGAHSFITDSGTGALRIQASDLGLETSAGNQNYLTGVDGGAVTVYHNGSPKIATSSSGATVTGDLAVTGDLNITGNVNSASVTDLDVTDKTITLGAGQTEALSGGSGIIIDGSSASLLWDESATTWDFNNALNIDSPLDASLTLNKTTANTWNYLQFVNQGTRNFYVGTNNVSDFVFGADNSGDFYFTGGNVGIGATSPQGIFQVNGGSSPSGSNWINFYNNVGGSNPPAVLGGLIFGWNKSNGNGESIIAASAGGAGGSAAPRLDFGLWDGTNYERAMVIDSNARVGINEITPDAYLHITGKTSYTTANDSEVSGLGFVRFQPNDNSEHSLWFHNASNNLGISGYTDAATSSSRDISLQAYGGNVSIGTPTATGAKLHVAGGIKGTDLIAHDSTGINLQTDEGTKRLIVDDAGFVVITDDVTYTANAPTHRGSLILAGASGFSNYGGLEFHTSSGGGAGYGTRIVSSDASLFIGRRFNATGWTESMRINDSGNVGIGAQNLQATFSVKQSLTQASADLRVLDLVIPGSWSLSGNAGHTADITWTNADAAGNYVMGKFGLRYAGTATGGSSEWVFKDMFQGGYGNSADIMYLGSNGYVGIPGRLGINDNTPSYPLDVNGVIGIKSNEVIDSDGTSHYFKTPAGGAMYFYHGTSGIMYVSSAGLLPVTDNARDLGSTSNRWRNVYTTDLHLSNEGKPEGNEVDGTTGNWTIQEGEEHLYIINNKSGKKYRFALEEIE